MNLTLLKSPWFISVLAGLLLACSFPTIGVPFLLFPAFILLFTLAEKADSGKQLAYWSYPAFVIWNLLTTYWLMFATFGGGLAAILANAVLMTIPLAWMRKVLISTYSFYLKALFAASIWTLYEFLHFNWDLAWPWISLGNAFGDYPKLVQFIEFTGQLGITFLVIVISVFLFEISKQFKSVELPWWKHFLYFYDSKTKRPLLGSVLYLCLAIVGFSLILYFKNANVQTTKLAEIAVIQPNYDSYLPDAGFTDYDISQKNLLQLADSARTDSTRLILFPENSIQPLISLHSPITREMSDSAFNWNLTLVSGLNEIFYYENDSAPRVYRGIRYGKAFDVFNSSFVWQANGTTTPYRKYNLVPIVERIPFVNFLAWIDVFKWVDWGSIAGFGKGNEVVNASFEGGSASILICYDSVFPNWSRKYVLEGANLIGIITNDGWWGNTPGHEQHFSFGRLRAIESRRSIARSANNGISGFILPSGEVLKRTTYWTRTYVRESIPLRNDLTFYVRFGDWIGWISLAFVLFFSLGFKTKKSE